MLRLLRHIPLLVSAILLLAMPLVPHHDHNGVACRMAETAVHGRQATTGGGQQQEAQHPSRHHHDNGEPCLHHGTTVAARTLRLSGEGRHFRAPQPCLPGSIAALPLVGTGASLPACAYRPHIALSPERHTTGLRAPPALA